MTKVFSIGVYGTTEKSFFQKLVDEKIDLFIDTRARRGMRGPTYAYVNNQHLQQELGELGIAYAYMPYLAPTPEIRKAQADHDEVTKTKKRDRKELCGEYRELYNEMLFEENFCGDQLLTWSRNTARLPDDQEIVNIAIFCVEREPRACHRSLITDVLEVEGFEVEHLQA